MSLEVLLLPLIISLVRAGIWSDDELPWIPQQFANVKGCYFNEISNVIPYNETIQISGYCYVMKCTEEKIIYSACGVLLSDDIDCDIKYIRYTIPYPECCDHIRCLQSYINKPSSRLGSFTAGNPRQTRKMRMRRPNVRPSAHIL